MNLTRNRPDEDMNKIGHVESGLKNEGKDVMCTNYLNRHCLLCSTLGVVAHFPYN